MNFNSYTDSCYYREINNMLYSMATHTVYSGARLCHLQLVKKIIIIKKLKKAEEEEY